MCTAGHSLGMLYNSGFLAGASVLTLIRDVRNGGIRCKQNAGTEQAQPASQHEISPCYIAVFAGVDGKPLQTRVYRWIVESRLPFSFNRTFSDAES